MPARPTPDSPVSCETTNEGWLSGITKLVVNGRNSIVVPPGSVSVPVRSSVSRCSAIGRPVGDDSSRSRTPLADTIAVLGASAGKMASTRNPYCAVSASKSASNRSVATTTWASRTPSAAPVATEAGDVSEDQAVLVEDHDVDRLHHTVV